MSEYESLSKKELVKIIHALLKDKDEEKSEEELSPLEYLFQYYTKRGYYFRLIEVWEHGDYWPRRVYIIATKEEPDYGTTVDSFEEITEDLIPDFLKCIGDIIKQDE